MLQTRLALIAATAALIAATPFSAAAQSYSDGPPSGSAAGASGTAGGRPHGPPPWAIAACSGKAIGTTVSITGPGGRTFTGTCVRQGDVVAVAPPTHMPAASAGGKAPPQ